METETLEPILAEHPVLRDLDPKYLKLLVGCATNVRFNAGQFILRDGGDADSFYLIRQGRVAVEIAAPGRGPVVIQTLGEGDALGWSWLVPPYKRRFDARAVELTRAIALDGKCLRKKLEEDHDLGYQLLMRFALIIAKRMEATRMQLLDLYGNRD